jgi:aryl-alcohol dehydrogenase-like predicted oxidoreductase
LQKDHNLKHNLLIADRIVVFDERKRCTPAQLALAWLLAQGEDIVPIPGTRSMQRLDENIGALGVHLTKADLEEINHLIPINTAAGE